MAEQNDKKPERCDYLCGIFASFCAYNAKIMDYLADSVKAVGNAFSFNSIAGFVENEIRVRKPHLDKYFTQSWMLKVGQFGDFTANVSNYIGGKLTVVGSPHT